MERGPTRLRCAERASASRCQYPDTSARNVMIDPPQWIVPAGNIDSIRLACINWCCNGIANARIITSASGEYLCDIVRAQHGDTALFVNCSMVTHCLNEALDKFAKFCGQSKRNVLFYNVTDAVAKQIELSRGDRVSTQDDGTKVVEWSAQANCFRQVAAKTSRIARADQNFINKAIRGCFRAASPSKRMESTPLLCNGTFDAGVIIHDAVCFAKLMAIAGERAAAWAQSVSPGGMYDCLLYTSPSPRDR